VVLPVLSVSVGTRRIAGARWAAWPGARQQGGACDPTRVGRDRDRSRGCPGPPSRPRPPARAAGAVPARGRTDLGAEL